MRDSIRVPQVGQLSIGVMLDLCAWRREGARAFDERMPLVCERFPRFKGGPAPFAVVFAGLVSFRHGLVQNVGQNRCVAWRTNRYAYNKTLQ
jgi:hypothetical protein